MSRCVTCRRVYVWLWPWCGWWRPRRHGWPVPHHMLCPMDGWLR